MKYFRIFLLLGVALAAVLLSGCSSNAITPGRYSLADSFTIVVDFLPDGRYYLNNHEYYDLSFGEYTVNGSQVTFVEKNGICTDEPGVYTVSEEVRLITFTEVKDSCPNRSYLLTRTTFIRLRQQNDYAVTLNELHIDKINYIAVDAEDNLYISDGLASIKKFNPQGEQILSWGNVIKPSGLTVAPDGSVFVANMDGLTISKFDSEGQELLTFPVGTNVIGPADVGLDGDGNLYVILKNVQDHYVEKFTPEGESISSWAGQGKNKGQVWGTFNYTPSQIAVDASGNNFVPDPNNDRVIKFDKDGIYLQELTGDDLRTLIQPRFVAVDNAGLVYVLDNSQTIWKFDTTGKVMGKWFSIYWGPLAVANSGDIVVADWNIAARISLGKK